MAKAREREKILIKKPKLLLRVNPIVGLDPFNNDESI